ncbi:MAG: sporulation protein YqfD [Lachnospiraceae bacterium]|nr:sporulation protein YqfD [Lachnospiraceae bacterium]
MVCRSENGSWERFMNMCRHHNIRMWNIRREEAVYFHIYASEFRKLIPLAGKTRVRPHLTQKKGLPFWLHEMKKNWTFYSGFLLFLVLLQILSSFVWEITYNGQSSYSRETLEKTVEEMQVYPGMKRSRLDCDAIEKKLREIYPDISWVSAEEVGSVLKISIKEGKKTITHEKAAAPEHLTARYNGVVQDIMVNRGTAKVKKGQKVKKGDILISGVVPVTDDSDQVTEKMTVAAKGEVTLLVEREFSEEFPLDYQKKVYTGRRLYLYDVELGSQFFSIKNPLKQLDKSCKYDIISTVRTDRLIHPLSFPVKVTEREYREYQIQEAVYTREELKEAGMKRYQQILGELTRDKMELVSHSAALRQKDTKTWLLQGKISFLCRSMETRAVTKKESEVKKSDGETERKSGNPS